MEKAAYSGASSEAIQHHYDVGNDFYRLWLDPTLTYSGAMWRDGDTLEQAQLRKIDFHIESSGAATARRVLDVGCGWGSVLQRLVAKHGVATAVGLTLSEAQAGHISDLNLPGVAVHVRNWADFEPGEPFDAIISIGAFEHFARLNATNREKVESYRRFFQWCRQWLKPGCRLSLQTFAYGSARRREEVTGSQGTQFLAKEIFPETDPPRLRDIVEASEGSFEFEALHNDAPGYARTCKAWLGNLRAERPAAVRLVGEETTSKYERYLKLSAVGFQTGFLALYRITLSRIGR